MREISRRDRRAFRVVVEETLQRGLSSTGRGAARRKVKIEPRAIGVKPAYRGMSMNQLYDELESR